MSRKKHRSAGTVVPVKEPAPRPVTRVPAEPLPPTAAAKAPAPPRPQSLDWPVKLLRALGSLHLAVTLLSTAVVVLFLGSWLESKFDAKISQEFVYRTWWFTLLLLLFGINIFFAAVKKWPWKKHQIGFLITHLGLLTMLAGGIINSVAGVDAEMQLVDSPQPEVQKELDVAQQTSEIIYRDQTLINVRHQEVLWKVENGQRTEMNRKNVSSQRFPLNPGVQSWGDAEFASRGSLLLRFLDGLAHPLPRSWSQQLDGGAKLSIKAYYPHALRDLYAPATDGKGFPALKVRLMSERHPPSEGNWLALNPNNRNATFNQERGSPARIELNGICPDALIPEFLKPPAAQELGPKGQLVLFVGGKKQTFDVEKHLGKTVPLSPTQWQLRLLSYEPTSSRRGGATAAPIDPTIAFLLISPQGKSYPCRLFARGQVDPICEEPPAQNAEPLPACWYHPPDFRFGVSENQLRGLLQLVQSTSGKIYYRSFINRATFQVEAAGEVEPDTDYNIWPMMEGKFSVVQHYPTARYKISYVPKHLRPALKREDLYTVFKCYLEGVPQGKDGEPLDTTFDLATPTFSSQSNSHEVPIRREVLSDGLIREEVYQITSTWHTERLGFDIKLYRAESQVAPGTDRDATYTSFVQVIDPPESVPLKEGGRKNSIFGWLTGDVSPSEPVRKDVMITMNQPLNYRGYKLYQSNFTRIGPDENDRPIHFSGLTVGRDPGLWLKYLGSTMLALGIACMFYMRAYSLDRILSPRKWRRPVAAPHS
jgi:hypothetical protein